MTWDDILWAAITVGRPNRQFVFKYGRASFYEAIFRWSMVRMALEQAGPSAYRLRRTQAAMTLDPSEKGAINYFLGLIFCKLFAAKLLNTPWLLHLDVFRPMLNPLLKRRSRPDLVGQVNGKNVWHGFECKGRISQPNDQAKQKAKEQAQQLIKIQGTNVKLHVGAITFFRRDALHFYWVDPEGVPGTPVEAELPADAWRHYYSPATALLRGSGVVEAPLHDLDDASHGAADASVEAHPAIAAYLFDGQWDAARRVAIEARETLARDGFQPDGLRVEAGDSWSRPYREPVRDHEVG